jgi:hypothetical protein
MIAGSLLPQVVHHDIGIHETLRQGHHVAAPAHPTVEPHHAHHGSPHGADHGTGHVPAAAGD